MRWPCFPCGAILLALALGGCQAVSPGSSQQLVGTQRPPADEVVARDDDTFRGRLTTGTREISATVAKPFDPTYWQEKQVERQVKKKQLAAAAKQRPAPKRSALSKWLFPEPKKPQTLSQWLAQDRPKGN